MAKTSIINLLLLFTFSLYGEDVVVTNKTVFKSAYNITPFLLFHKKDYGGGISLSTTKTNLVGFGAAFACINEQNKLSFYSANLSIKLGKTVQLNAYNGILLYLETGADINIANIKTVYNQTIIGANLTHTFKSNMKESLGFGLGRNSKWGNDIFYIVTMSFSF